MTYSEWKAWIDISDTVNNRSSESADNSIAANEKATFYNYVINKPQRLDIPMDNVIGTMVKYKFDFYTILTMIDALAARRWPNIHEKQVIKSIDLLQSVKPEWAENWDRFIVVNIVWKFMFPSLLDTKIDLDLGSRVCSFSSFLNCIGYSSTKIDNSYYLGDKDFNAVLAEYAEVYRPMKFEETDTGVKHSKHLFRTRDMIGSFESFAANRNRRTQIYALMHGFDGNAGIEIRGILSDEANDGWPFLQLGKKERSFGFLSKHQRYKVSCMLSFDAPDFILLGKNGEVIKKHITSDLEHSADMSELVIKELKDNPGTVAILHDFYYTDNLFWGHDFNYMMRYSTNVINMLLDETMKNDEKLGATLWACVGC